MDLSEVEVDAVRKAARRIDESGEDERPDISDLAQTWQDEVRALVAPLIARDPANPRAEAWRAGDRLISALENVETSARARSVIANEFAWDDISRRRFEHLIERPDDPPQS